MVAAKLCLKARPTAAQLRDRLQPVDAQPADGLELYLAAVDLATPAALDGVVERLESAHLPAEFALLIEGPPIRSTAVISTSHAKARGRGGRHTVGRPAKRIHARGQHSFDCAERRHSRLTLDCRQGCEQSRAIHACVHGADHQRRRDSNDRKYAKQLRMRRSDFAFTPIGMCAEDLNWMVEQVAGLKVLVDTSHAGST
jgi:hypothetical protein